MVVSELRGEKIDIIPWNTEPARFVAKALSPARVREVYIDDETREATVVVPDDQLALAIGKEGLNARLAARLTGWKVDIQSDSEFAQAEAEAAYGGGEDRRGVLGPLRRDALERQALPERGASGPQYCGVPAHQALASSRAGATPVEVPTVAEVEEAIEDAARIAVAEDIAAAATLEAVVEEAVATVRSRRGRRPDRGGDRAAAVEESWTSIAAAAELESTIEHDGLPPPRQRETTRAA